MKTIKRDILEVLKAELEFLEKGGYRHTARADWRPQFMFQDSPTCLNFDPAQAPRPCTDCVLMQLIPKDLQDKKIACRYIPLSESGETIDSFYRTGTQEELETAVAAWLKTMIAKLELERARIPDASEHTGLCTKAKACGSTLHTTPTELANFDDDEGHIVGEGTVPPRSHAI